MDLCHSVEILIYSLLGCSGKIFLFVFLQQAKNNNHEIVMRFGFLQKKGQNIHIYHEISLYLIVKSAHVIVLCHIVEVIKMHFIYRYCCHQLL